MEEQGKEVAPSGATATEFTEFTTSFGASTHDPTATDTESEGEVDEAGPGVVEEDAPPQRVSRSSGTEKRAKALTIFWGSCPSGLA